jgi:hypothetical protein
MVMTMKNTVFWDVQYSYLFTLVHRSWIASTLKMEAIRSSETSVNKIPTRRHIPEDGILQCRPLIFMYTPLQMAG